MTKQEQIDNIASISFGSKNIPLKTERLKAAFKKLQGHQNEIETKEKALFEAKQASKPIGEVISDLIKSYLKLADIIDETQAVIKKDKTEESKKSE